MEKQLKDNIKPSPKEMYDALAHQIEREDNLVNNRINWFLVAQGFLFATVGLIMDSNLENCWKTGATKGIAILGGLIVVSVLFGVVGAEISLCNLRKRWKKMEKNYIGYFPPPFGRGCASVFGCIPRIFMPFVLVIAWICLFFNIDKVF